MTGTASPPTLTAVCLSGTFVHARRPNARTLTTRCGLHAVHDGLPVTDADVASAPHNYCARCFPLAGKLRKLRGQW